MKHLSIIALAAGLASFPAFARADDGPQTSITLESQNYVIKRSVEPDLNGTIARPLIGPFGVYSFFYVDKTYAEAIVGPLWVPTKWLALGAGVGVAQSDGAWRAGGMVWLGNDKVVSTTLVETGAGGFWAREEIAWKPRPWIGLGGLGDTAVGFGPRVEIDVPHTPFQIWGAVLYAKDGDTSIPAFGFRLNI